MTQWLQAELGWIGLPMPFEGWVTSSMNDTLVEYEKTTQDVSNISNGYFINRRKQKFIIRILQLTVVAGVVFKIVSTCAPSNAPEEVSVAVVGGIAFWASSVAILPDDSQGLCGMK